MTGGSTEVTKGSTEAGRSTEVWRGSMEVGEGSTKVGGESLVWLVKGKGECVSFFLARELICDSTMPYITSVTIDLTSSEYIIYSTFLLYLTIHLPIRAE